MKNRDFDLLRVGIRKKSKQRKVAFLPGPSDGAIRIALQPFLPRIFFVFIEKISIFLYSDMHTVMTCHVCCHFMSLRAMSCHVLYRTVYCTVSCLQYSTITEGAVATKVFHNVSTCMYIVYHRYVAQESLYRFIEGIFHDLP